jgi:hypothetical protein
MNKKWDPRQPTPYGMANYGRWFDPDDAIPMVSLTDIDGVLQSDKWQQAIFFEFKPANGEITIGQAILHNFLSTREGQMSILVFDYYANDNSDDEIEQDIQFKMTTFIDGETETFKATLADLNEAIYIWWKTGKFTLGPATFEV